MAYGDGPLDEALARAWRQFCDKLQDAGQQIFKPENPGDPLQRVDALRFLTQNLGQAFDLALETRNAAFPLLHPFVTPTRKLGADAADLAYHQAWIDGHHQYRLHGNTGSARFFNIAVQGARPAEQMGIGGPPLHEPFGDIPECNIFGHDLVTEADGSFELYIGGEERGPNWLPSTPQTRKLFIRQGFDAWSERPALLSIERIGMASPRPMPDAPEMIAAIGWAEEFLTGAMQDWPDHPYAHSGGVVDPAYPNRFPPDRNANTADDAKRGRMAAHMCWNLPKDQALIVSFDAHDGFWMVSLGGVFMNSFDYLYRPVSYTPSRAAIDGDGKVRLVLAHEDPGVQNWLDTQGFAKGNLTYRNLLSQTPTVFETQMVPVGDLENLLPRDTRRIGKAERIEQMAERNRAIRARYRI